MAAILKFCFQGHIKLNGLIASSVHSAFGLTMGAAPINSVAGHPRMMAMPVPVIHNQHYQHQHFGRPIPMRKLI